MEKARKAKKAVFRRVEVFGCMERVQRKEGLVVVIKMRSAAARRVRQMS